MRWFVVAAVVPLLGLSGCFSAGSSLAHDCSSSTSQAVAVQRSMLLPEEPVDTPYEEEGNRIVVHARDGQTIVAQAVWKAGAGQAKVDFDGPAAHQVSTEATWTVVTHDVPAGPYTLEIVGDPFAFEVVYTLQLVAQGCTPT